VCIVFVTSQIIPPSFATPNTDGKPRYFEALFPRVDGPADTRHFEKCAEQDSIFNISADCHEAANFDSF
jgi:hypothetical protein